MYNLWQNHAIRNDIDSNRFLNRGLRSHNSHHRVSVLCTTLAIFFINYTKQLQQLQLNLHYSY